MAQNGFFQPASLISLFFSSAARCCDNSRYPLHCLAASCRHPVQPEKCRALYSTLCNVVKKRGMGWWPQRWNRWVPIVQNKKKKKKNKSYTTHTAPVRVTAPLSQTYICIGIIQARICERRLHCSLSVSTTARLLDRCLLVCLLVGGLCGRVWVDVYGREKKGDRIFIPLLRLLPGQHGTNFLYHRSS